MRNPEKIKAPVGGRKWKRQKDREQADRFKNTHYSNKTGHEKRSDHHQGKKKKTHR